MVSGSEMRWDGVGSSCWLWLFVFGYSCCLQLVIDVVCRWLLMLFAVGYRCCLLFVIAVCCLLLSLFDVGYYSCLLLLLLLLM